MKVATVATLDTVKSSRNFGHEISLKVTPLVTLNTVKSSRNLGHERSLKVATLVALRIVKSSWKLNLCLPFSSVLKKLKNFKVLNYELYLLDQFILITCDIDNTF